MGSSQLKHVRNCSTSRETLLKLESVYGSKGPARKATLLEQLLSKKMREGKSVREHLSTFMETVYKLKQMQIEKNRDLLAIMILHSLPSSYENFCCAIKSRDNLLEINGLMEKIIEESYARDHRSSDKGVAGAMVAKSF